MQRIVVAVWEKLHEGLKVCLKVHLNGVFRPFCTFVLCLSQRDQLNNESIDLKTAMKQFICLEEFRFWKLIALRLLLLKLQFGKCLRTTNVRVKL